MLARIVAVGRLAPIGLATALALAAPPALAQNVSASDAAMARMAEMFPVEPLTGEEKARLPAARDIIARIMPPGAMEDLMGAMFDRMLGPIMAMGRDDPAPTLQEALGVSADDLGLDADAAIEVATIIDPYWRTKRDREAAVFPTLMEEAMLAMEPTMRKAMAELYAIYFDAGELADIDAFFATPSGAAYARKSFTMSSDPRMVSAMMSEMPQMRQTFASMEARMAAAVADLPAPRKFVELDEADRRRLAELTDLSREDLAYVLSSEADIEPADGMK